MARETWKTMSRAAAVVRVLETAPGPVSPKDVESTLAAKGREDVNIHQTLSSLGRQGRIANVGRGEWTTLEAAEKASRKSTRKAA